MTLDDLIAKYPEVRLLVDVEGIAALDGKMVADAIECARKATVRAETAEARVAELEGTVKYLRATIAAMVTAPAPPPSVSVIADPTMPPNTIAAVDGNGRLHVARTSDPEREPVVWADEASPFTGAQVKDLLEENERLQRACSETPGVKP